MRSLIAVVPLVILAACGFSAGAHDGDQQSASAGPAERRDFQVGSFQSVSLGGSHDVVVKVGPAASVYAEGPADELDRLDIRVQGGDLRIGTKRNRGFNMGSWHKVTVYVTTPQLAAASIGGSGGMKIDRVDAERFKAQIGGSGNMDIASLKAGDAELSIAGSGSIRAAGHAQRQNISIAGSGDVDASGLESRTASISMLGSGDVSTRATETADVNIMGSGDVTLGGGAKCAVHKMGSGAVHCIS